VTDGEISGELDREAASQESIMGCIMSHKRGAKV